MSRMHLEHVDQLSVSIDRLDSEVDSTDETGTMAR